MRSEKELDLECYFPQRPVKWDKPITEDYMIKFYKDMGWLDENGNITQRGRENAGVCEDEMNGTETEEHYQKRLKLHQKQLDFCYDWFERKWGENGHKPHYDLPFPEEEYKKITLDTIDN